MNRCAVVLLLASLASAQTTPPDRVPESIVYEFKNVEINRAMEITNFVQTLMNNRVQIQVNGPFKTAIIRPNGSVPADSLSRAEDLLKRYDVAPPPEPQVDFIAYLVRASTRAQGEAAPSGQPIPPVLQEAVAEMKKTFAYTDYTLLDTVETVVHHNSQIESMLPGRETNGVTPYFYEISYSSTAVSTDRKTVTIDPFKFTVRIPVVTGGDAPKYQDSGISTYVAIHEGQKLVIGKVRTGPHDPADVFLILTMKLR
jgi:hypothetical protein